MKQDFFTPRFTGARLLEHTIPVDVLPDVAALQEMLVELAKAAYLEQHPERSRAPRNFDKNVQIHVAAVEDGSAKLKLVLFFAGLFTQFQPAFSQAQDQVTKAVMAAAHGERPALGPKYLSYFERIGRGLEEGEALEFPTPAGYATLNQEIRRRLIEASLVEEWTDRATLRAKVPGVNYRTEKFEVILTDGTVLNGSLQPSIREEIRAAHEAYPKGKDEWLLLECVVRKDRSDKIRGIESVEHVTLLEPLDVPLRLAHLAKLSDGWLNGEGHSLSADGLNLFSRLFDKHFDPSLPVVHVYPTPEGRIQAESDAGDWSVSLDIDLPTPAAFFEALEVNSEEVREKKLKLTDKEDWDALNKLLRELFPAADEAERA
jgi:hypothetical protein